MSGAQSISTRRAYGVQRVCRVWHCARSSVYARRQATPSPAPCRRRGPVGAAPDDVLVAHVRRVLEASPFHGEGYRKVWVKLRVKGRRTSKERVRRLMREHDLQAPQRAGHAHGPKAHDGTITTEAPDVMWGMDMTATVTVAEGPAFVFVAVDHCTAECIGLHAAKRGTRFEALEPIRQGIRERFGGIGEGMARGLRLRHDHGSNYLADDFQQEVAFFGIESSPSFVREPEGNGVAERFIRTLKENLLWVRSFATIEALRLALLAFKRTYNEQWMLEKYDYRSPAQVRREDFKRYSIYYAGKHMKMNASLLARRYRLLSGVILLFVLEALLFGAAVTLFQNASIERTSQDQVRAEAAAESKRAQQILAADPALVSRRLIVPRRCPEHQSAGHHYRLILRSCADATPRHMGRQGGCIPTSLRWRSPSYWKRA